MGVAAFAVGVTDGAARSSVAESHPTPMFAEYAPPANWSLLVPQGSSGAESAPAAQT